MCPGGQQQTAVTQAGNVLLDQQEIIGVIKDQQPALLALLQPAFDRFHDLALIRFVVCNQ